MKKTMLTSLIFLNWLFIYSCHMLDSGDSLPGKIVVSKTIEHECLVYVDSDMPKSSFKERNSNEVQYSVLAWLNTKDTFVGTESIPGLIRIQYRSNIVEFDLSGKIINRIYEAEYGELAWPLYSSRDDKYLLFTTHREVDPKLYPYEGLAPMLSLVILDLGQNKVITKIDSIGRFPNFLIKESPWLREGYQFVYSIDGGIQLKGEEKIINPVEVEEGIYIYDINSGKSKLLVPGGRSAIASPTNNQIAFEEDNSIKVLDLNTKELKTIYKFSSKERIRGKHWTPDGRNIYFAYTYNWGIGDMFHTGEKLIDINSRKEKPFKKIGLGFNSYSWK